MNATLRQVLDAGKKRIISVAPGDTVHSAVVVMSGMDVGAVLVMEEGRLLGILSERDFVKKMLVDEKSLKKTLVREVMTKDPYCAKISSSIESCIALMSEHRFRHLPIIDADSKLVGIVSMGDLVKEVVAEQSFMLDQFERYIYSGGYGAYAPGA